jgi:guanosine-3',5'-bis(diphosphate) 3'-pyrophosphohydrolase
MPHSFKFNELRSKLEKYLEPDQIEKIYEAYLFAAHAHKNQFRLSGEPYITHPLAVSCILADLKLDYQSILAALLHDLLEDTKISKLDLAAKYGETVAELVDGVSKLKQLNFSTRAQAQAENLRKMMLAMVRDIRVIIIKMADRLHNMQTLGALRPDKRRRIARETLDIYAPIANRLGMYYFKTAFENYGFNYLHPMRARVLNEQVNKEHRQKSKLIDSIKEKISSKLEATNISKYKIIGREKNIYSIYKKMKEKHILFKEMMDIYAFRIEVESQDECYRILGLMHSIFKPVPNKFKDYIAIPKINGYQSLHTVLRGPHGVPIEIQIRTFEMSNLAENGIAAHWLYKSCDASITDAQLRAREWFASLLEIQKRVGDDSMEFIENVKIDLFPDELYVFTPKGSIIKLQSGSTPVDFAYAVHTDIGNACVATRIDNRLAPLNTILKSGQTVEIITSPDARPNIAWLTFVQTGKARSGVREFLKTQKDEDICFLGETLLSAALQDADVALETIDVEVLHKFLKEYHLSTIDDLYKDIGCGNRLAFVVARRLIELLKPNSQVKLQDYDNKSIKPIAIKGTEGLAISYAECCYPVPGDSILGIFIENHGLEVHQENCEQQAIYKNHKNPKNTVNKMQLCWAENIEGMYKVKINIDVANQRGMLAKLAMAIAECKANIEKITSEDQDGGLYTTMKMLIGVRSTRHLSEVISKLRKITHVNKVERE